MSRLTAGFILILIAALGAYFFAWPQWQKAGALRSEIDELRALSEELERLAAKRDALTAEYNRIPEADLTTLLDVAPREAQTGNILGDLEVLAASKGLELARIDFAASERAKPALSVPSASQAIPIPFALSLRGGYQPFLKFLGALEYLVRITDVTDIDFSGGGEPISFNLKGRFYARP